MAGSSVDSVAASARVELSRLQSHLRWDTAWDPGRMTVGPCVS
jgi:hypothetical protein